MWGTRSASAQLAVVISLSVALFGSLPPALAQAPPAPEKIREIFVPFEDLNVILESDAQRAFLTRQEYEELIAKAAAKPVVKVPLSAAVVAAQYTARLEEARALIDGKLQVDLLEDGLFAVPLELGGVGIRSALLDGKPAPLSRNEQGQVVLFVQGAGKHELVLALTAPVATSAATQTLSLSLPLTAATKLELTVPGDVEIRGGASVVNRTFDAAAGLTKFELLPQRGQMGIVMSLNNKMLQEQRVVVASSVLVTEVTQGYERLHATVSHRVLHGAVDKLRFELPAGFEVTQVASPLLARWEVKKDAMPAVLEAILREPTTEPIVLAITATRSPPALEKWSLPRLVPLDVAGQVAVVGLLVEDRFDPQRITTGGSHSAVGIPGRAGSADRPPDGQLLCAGPRISAFGRVCTAAGGAAHRFQRPDDARRETASLFRHGAAHAAGRRPVQFSPQRAGALAGDRSGQGGRHAADLRAI
jgi:hypothetical protein